MPRQSPLKVFRTPIGFHDAFVAAPSRKAALAAWGAEKDLFASGSAELVTDPELTAAPLAAPGTVIRRSRGDLADHLRAAATSGRKAKSAEPTPDGAGKPNANGLAPRKPAAPKPRPSRAAVARAEKALQAFEARAETQRAELDRREAQLLKQRKALNLRHRSEADNLERRLEKERSRHEEAMERWRAE